MKTLNEVIQEFERQEAFVAYYMQDKTQFRSDALYYLKEYQKLINVPDINNNKGYWRVTYDGLHCSICNYKLDTTAIPDICPSCGAKMGYEYRWTT